MAEQTGTDRIRVPFAGPGAGTAPLTWGQKAILHDMRETGWAAQMPFETGLKATIAWYRANSEWIARVKSGEYQSYYEKNYGGR